MSDRQAREVWLKARAGEIAEVVMAKRDDYGTDNINMTGQAGIATRLLDKAARLVNLTRSRPEGREPVYEPFTDSYADAVGYALIGLWMEETGEPW